MATLALEIEELTSLLPCLAASDISFATNLINRFNRYGNLSDNSAPWVPVLIDRAKGIDTRPQRPSANVGDLSGLIALFKTAGAAKLKYPKIRLQVNGINIVLSVAGPKSKNAGCINIAGEGSWDSRAWYGKVTPEGRFDGSRALTPVFAAALVPVLTELANDPMAAVRRYGSLTGNCMFCRLPLTDERSLNTGCGETCAKHYGLHDAWKTAAKIAA